MKTCCCQASTPWAARGLLCADPTQTQAPGCRKTSLTSFPSEGQLAVRVCQESNPDLLIHNQAPYLYTNVAGDKMMKRSKHRMPCAIHHIAITNCPFRFAFSHLPNVGNFCDQSTGAALHVVFVQVFLRSSNSSTANQSVMQSWLVYGLNWLAGIRKSKENLHKKFIYRKVASVTKVAHILWWRNDNRKQYARVCEHWCKVGCDIQYFKAAA